jgi:ubiquitination network signaling protein AcrB
LQKEVDSLTSRLSSNGGNDERQRQKVQQLKQSMQQAKIKEVEIQAEIDDLGDIPEDEFQQAKLKKTSWNQEKDRQSASSKEYDECKAKADRELSQVKADIANLLQKRQKFEQKATKYSEQHDRLVTSTSQTQETQARRIAQRDEELHNRSQTEHRWADQTTILDRDAQAYYVAGLKAHEQCAHLEDLYNKNLQQQSMPNTPEGPLPGTTRSIHHHNTFPGFQPNFQFPSMVSGFPDLLYHSNPTSMYREGGRGRSSSMLSGVSGFTDELDDYPLPAYSAVYPVTNGAHSNMEYRKSSAGSGSTSSASGNSSTMDPMSPVPSKSLSPMFKDSASPISPPVTTAGVR